MHPPQPDFTEANPEEERERNARRLGFLIPLIVAIPITVAVVSEKFYDLESAYSPNKPLDYPVEAFQPSSIAAVESLPPQNLLDVGGMPSTTGSSYAIDPLEPLEPLQDLELDPSEESVTEPVVVAAPLSNEPVHEPVSLGPQRHELVSTPAASPTTTIDHRVQPGETLLAISRHHGVPAHTIALHNGIGLDDVLPAGILLRIPTGSEAFPTQPAVAGDPVTPSAEPQPREIRVRKGDTLYGLSRRHGVALETLADANGIRLTDPLLEGQILVLPPSSTSASLSPETPSLIPAGGDEASSALSPLPRLTPVSGLPVDPAKTVTGSCRYCIAYVVQPQDSLASIASAHSTSPAAIRALNHGIERIFPGQALIVPADNCIVPSH